MTCELCSTAGGTVLWRDALCRIIHVDEPAYPGYCRVIWNTHVKEMTDLDAGGRAHVMRVVLAVEAVLRDVLHPHKINLASLGNMAPHVHWHIIPRFTDDPHFPQSIWSVHERAAVQRNPADVTKIASALQIVLGPGIPIGGYHPQPVM